MVQRNSGQRFTRSLFVWATGAFLIIGIESCGGNDSDRQPDSLASDTSHVSGDSSNGNTIDVSEVNRADSPRSLSVCQGVSAVKRGDGAVFGRSWLVKDIADDSCSMLLLDSATARVEKNHDTVSLAWLVDVAERSDGALADAMTDYMSKAFIAMPVETSMQLAQLPDTLVTMLTVEGIKYSIDNRGSDRIGRASIVALRKHLTDPRLSPKAAGVLAHIIDEGVKPEK